VEITKQETKEEILGHNIIFPSLEKPIHIHRICTV